MAHEPKPIVRISMSNLSENAYLSEILSRLLELMHNYAESEFTPEDGLSEIRKVSKEWVMNELIEIAEDIGERIGTCRYVYEEDCTSSTMDPVISSPNNHSSKSLAIDSE